MLGTLLAVCAATLTQAADRVTSPGMDEPGVHEQPGWFKQSFLDLREDVAEARASNKRLMVYFYQDGCPYCARLLRDNFGQRRIAEKTRHYFDVVALNMWGDREVTDLHGTSTTEKEFARAQKVMFTPTLLLFDQAGEVVLRIDGYFPPHRFLAAVEYVGQGLDAKESFRAYLVRREPVPASGRLHFADNYLQEPYDLRAALQNDSRPLLVLFEQKQCRACDELHGDIFQRAATRKLLSRLQIVLLDQWADTPLVTPQGRRTTARAWASMLGVDYAPSMVFFDHSGRRVFATGGYLRAFHVQSTLDYVASGAYREQPEFQRYIEKRADELRSRGQKINLW
ncbi:thioredoxin family protein [Acidihalobacter prosperus]